MGPSFAIDSTIVAPASVPRAHGVEASSRSVLQGDACCKCASTCGRSSCAIPSIEITTSLTRMAHEGHGGWCLRGQSFCGSPCVLPPDEDDETRIEVEVVGYSSRLGIDRP